MQTTFRSVCAHMLVYVTLAATAAGADDVPATQSAGIMSYLDNGAIRLGVDRELGGAITWLSKSGDNSNLVNSWDWGRQIQMSFYSGPIPFTPEGKQPAPQWRGLGWNPIQSGDHFKNRANSIELRNDGKEIFVTCRPMQWPLDNVPAECIFESRLSLHGNTVNAHCRLINNRQDKTQYPARLQELPAIYSNGRWWKLMTYAGDKPFTGAPLEQIAAKMPWSQWNATENWAALVDDHDEGLGIWAPGVNLFSGGFNDKPGVGGPKDNPCGYIAPNHADILDNNIDYNYSYVLIVGSLAEIRKYALDHAKRGEIPDYHFINDRQHWIYHDVVDTGWTIRGALDITATGNDPYCTGPLTFWRADDAPILHIAAAFSNSSRQARIRWRAFDDKGFSDEKMLPFDVLADGEFHNYDIDLTRSKTYAGAMIGLRLDLVAPSPGGHVHIKSISFKNSK